MIEDRGNPQMLVQLRQSEFGLSDTELAAYCEITVDQYCDLLEERDEYFMVVPLATLSRLCSKLKIALTDLFGLSPCDAVSKEGCSVSFRREQHGLTIAQLSDLVGIEEKWLVELEEDPKSIGNWVMDPVQKLAHILEMNPACILKPILSVGSADDRGHPSTDAGLG